MLQQLTKKVVDIGYMCMCMYIENYTENYICTHMHTHNLIVMALFRPTQGLFYSTCKLEN